MKSLTEAAAARYLATEEGRRAAQMALVATVANADLAVRADDELLRVTQRALDSRLESPEARQHALRSGRGGRADLRSAESLVASARVSLYALQRNAHWI